MKSLLTAVLMTAMAVAQTQTPMPGTPKHHHHVSPIVIGLIAGAIGGAVIGIVTRPPSCPSSVMYEGKRYPYQGTAPCPGPNYDPTGKKK